MVATVFNHTRRSSDPELLEPWKYASPKQSQSPGGNCQDDRHCRRDDQCEAEKADSALLRRYSVGDPSLVGICAHCGRAIRRDHSGCPGGEVTIDRVCSCVLHNDIEVLLPSGRAGETHMLDTDAKRKPLL